jgi:hypothetical protein
MAKRSKKPADLNRLAAAVVGEATEADDAIYDTAEPSDDKDPAAVELGRRGGKKGGKSRAANMSAEERSAAARKAANARWAKR